MISGLTQPVGGRPTRRVTAAELGFNRLTRRLFVTQAAVLIVSLVLYDRLGLSVAWSTAIPLAMVPACVFAFWLYFYAAPGRSRRDWIIAESLFVLGLLSTFALIAPPAQYAAVALNRPLVDPWLAAADQHLGISVPALVNWTRVHPTVGRSLIRCYFTLLPQFFLPVFVLGMILQDRDALWEYAFHFHICSVITLAALAVFPAECAFIYYGYDSIIDQSRFIQHFSALRAGTFTVIRFDDIEGLISFPSFHVAGALMVTWACRRYRWLVAPLAIVNSGLILATFMAGAHYVVDVVATIAMFGASLAAYRWWGRPLMNCQRS